MDNVVSLCDFRRKKEEEEDKYESLSWAREYLEEDLFNSAMYEWPLEELERTRYQAEMYPTEAFEAYDLILRVRKRNIS